MKIAIVLFNASSSGSVFNATRKIAEGLSKKGTNVILISNTAENWAGVNIVVVPSILSFLDRVRVRFGRPSGRNERIRVLKQKAFIRSIDRIAGDFWSDIELTITPQHFCCRGLISIRRRFKIPFVLVSHGDVFSHPPEAFGSILRKWYENTAIEAYGSADKIIAVSQAIAKVAKKNGASDVTVIPNGFEIEETKGGDRPEMKFKLSKFNFCFVGRLVAEKGLFVLLEAVHKIGNGGYKVFIIGEGPLEESLRERVASLSIQDRVCFLGSVQRRSLGYYYEMMDCLILPSLSEAQGVVLLEAAAYKLPIIATSVGGIPEIVENDVNGLLVKPCDSADLMKAMQKMMMQNFKIEGGFAPGTEKSWGDVTEAVLSTIMAVTAD